MKRIAFANMPYGRRWVLCRPWLWFIWLWDEAVAFVQRGLYGWAPQDVFDLGSYMCKVYPGALRRLADETRGAPLEFYPDEELELQGEALDAALDAGLERWKTALRKYADALEGLHAADTMEDLAAYDDARERARAAMVWLSQYLPSLWW